MMFGNYMLTIVNFLFSYHWPILNTWALMWAISFCFVIFQSFALDPFILNLLSNISLLFKIVILNHYQASCP